ncbi:MAG TPA: hypothetical protein VGF56_05165 [Rhizomicrobium sp.]|jgi:hypothetical protein
MIRIFFAAILLLLVTAGWMFSSYGEIDPCRALAVERARRGAHGLPVESALERVQRARTSQMPTSACVGGLIGDWWRRQAARQR